MRLFGVKNALFTFTRAHPSPHTGDSDEEDPDPPHPRWRRPVSVFFFQERVSHAVHPLCNRHSAYDETFSLTVIQRNILCEVLCLYVDMNVSKWLMMRRARFSKTAMMRRTHLVDEEDSHKRCVNEDGCKVAFTTV